MAGKLKNKQGATIMLALIFLLLSIMVSCVVLVAATAAVKAVDRERAQQQAFLEVSSAAQLLGRELERAQVNRETHITVNADNTTTSVVNPAEGFGSPVLQELMREAVQRLLDTPQATFEKSFEITQTGSDPSLMDTVQVVMTLRLNDMGRYVVQFVLNSQNPNTPCQLYVVAEGTATESTSGGGDHSVLTLTVKWENVTVRQEVRT